MKEYGIVPCGICGKPTLMTGTKRCDGCWEIEHRIKSAAGREVAFKVLGPIDMVLFCPACHAQHVDEPEERNVLLEFLATSEPWTNPPHRSHLCHHCGFVWRPADVPTNGVAAITTRGKNDS